jgi:hypothetical protein
VKFLDIKMFAADMGFPDIPDNHPDTGKFLPRRIGERQLFDLVFCDRHVLENMLQSEYPVAKRAIQPGLKSLNSLLALSISNQVIN